MIRALTRRLRALLALPGAVEAAVETAHLRAVVASQGASLLRRDAATAELMAERDDLRADGDRLAEVARREIADRDDYAIELLRYARRWKALAREKRRDVAMWIDISRSRERERDEALADLKLADEQTAEWCRQNNRHRAQWVQATEERDAALTDLAAARAEAERLSAELHRLRGP